MQKFYDHNHYMEVTVHLYHVLTSYFWFCEEVIVRQRERSFMQQ